MKKFFNLKITSTGVFLENILEPDLWNTILQQEGFLYIFHNYL